VTHQQRRTSEDQYLEILESFPALIWRAGTDGRCNYFNAMWLEFTGRAMEQEVGEGWAEGVHPEDFDRCLETYLGAFGRREPFHMDYRLRRHDGAYRWIADYGRPFHDLDGTFAGYIGSCYDITDRVDREQQLEDLVVQRTRLLEESMRETQLASDAKSRFLHAMSHELRTPLNSVLGFSGVMLDGLAGPLTEEQAKQLQMIRQAGSELLALVSDMLAVADLESAEAPFEAQPVRLASAVERAATEAGMLAGRDVTLPDSSDNAETIDTVPSWLHEALVYLFRAVEACPASGPVTVAIAGDADRVVVAIESEGRELADDLETSLDDDLTFLGTVEAHRPGRSGMEFTVARAAARRLGGSLRSAESAAGGSRIELALPRG